MGGAGAALVSGRDRGVEDGVPAALGVWEDALDDQLIEIVRNGSQASVVVTPHGLEALRGA